jgi:hypothetical protein
MGLNYVEVRKVKLNIINSIGIKNIRWLYLYNPRSQNAIEKINFKKYFYFSIYIFSLLRHHETLICLRFFKIIHKYKHFFPQCFLTGENKMNTTTNN